MRSLLSVLAASVLTAACTSSDSSSGGDDASFGPLDPGFANTPPNAWSLGGGATIEAYVPPGIDPGVARFDPAKVRSLALVAQTFAMPAFSATERYVLETAGLGAGVHVRIDNMTLDELALGSTLSKSRICLGERAFGHDINLAYATAMVSSNVDLDHVSILAAPECPTAGLFLSGDFESATGWTPRPGGGLSEIARSGGTANGRAGHLLAAAGTEIFLSHEPVSFPWKTVPRPALRFSFKGTAGITMSVGDLDKNSNSLLLFASLPPAATLAPALVCVPEWAKGLVLPIALRAAGSATAESEATFDDFSFVTEPSCPEAAHVIGGDFETAATALSWSTAGSSITSLAGAHTGRSCAALPIAHDCATASLSQLVTTPPAEPGHGPAVKFWYRTSAGAQARFSVGAANNGNELAAATAWTPRIICLDPVERNRPSRLEFLASGRKPPGLDCTGAAFPTETLAIDDVEVTTDPSCPSGL